LEASKKSKTNLWWELLLQTGRPPQMNFDLHKFRLYGILDIGYVAPVDVPRIATEMLDGGIEKNEAINWAITFKGENKLLGIIGFYRTKFEDYRSEIGYMLLAENQGKGIASEAVERALEYGFNEMKLHSIEAIIDPRNSVSEKVLIKNGFVKEGHFKENTFFNGEFLDSVIYSKIKKADL
jgi:RimJ/RimL family protein N-acetyltransferase